ncbi:protein transporter Sec31 [Streptomyces macrosporus]|uniref:Protein transporter Sec31 n=1 Tax=Streptomyces macrosporus TaxID=44032 RepID=A0ABN3KEW9_9ACTN
MKTRTVQRTRLVPHTIDGKTEMVLERYEEQVPVPPRDWDRTILAAVTAAAGLLLVICIGWTTASVGGLLDRVVHPVPAYGAALAFDLAWMMCMALEWLARYDTRRAALPRKAGHAALLMAMVAVAVHGHLEGALVVGLIGATVSAIVKGIWTVVLRHHAKPLDDKTQQWVDRQRADAGGQLAMVAVRRELARARALVAAEEAALRTAPDTVPDRPDTDPEQPTDRPETPEPVPALTTAGPMTVRDAVRNAADSGITDPDAVLRYVRTVADANAKEETVTRYLRAFRRSA